jgi:hypothetical protein
MRIAPGSEEGGNRVDGDVVLEDAWVYRAVGCPWGRERRGRLGERGRYISRGQGSRDTWIFVFWLLERKTGSFHIV